MERWIPRVLFGDASPLYNLFIQSFYYVQKTPKSLHIPEGKIILFIRKFFTNSYTEELYQTAVSQQHWDLVYLKPDRRVSYRRAIW